MRRVAIVGVLLLIGAACSSSDDPPVVPRTTVATTTPRGGVVDPELEATIAGIYPGVPEGKATDWARDFCGYTRGNPDPAAVERYVIMKFAGGSRPDPTPEQAQAIIAAVGAAGVCGSATSTTASLDEAAVAPSEGGTSTTRGGVTATSGVSPSQVATTVVATSTTRITVQFVTLGAVCSPTGATGTALVQGQPTPARCSSNRTCVPHETEGRVWRGSCDPPVTTTFPPGTVFPTTPPL